MGAWGLTLHVDVLYTVLQLTYKLHTIQTQSVTGGCLVGSPKLPLVMLGLNQPHLVRSDLVLFQYLQQPATTATVDLVLTNRTLCEVT